jgi:hypothetical protein
VTRETKRNALLLLALVIVTTFLIGSGLPRLRFEPGLPLPSLENSAVVASPAEALPSVAVPIPTFLLVLFVTLLVAYLSVQLVRLIRGVHWRDILSTVLSFLLSAVILFGLVFMILLLLPRSEAPPAALPVPEPTPVLRSPLGPVPPLLLWLVGIGLFLAVVLVGYVILRTRPSSSLELWELAEQARDDLLAGADLKDVILRCYQRMSRTLQEDQGIEREAAMTVGEFEDLLAARGFPQDPVHQLTLLFQTVRYGQWRPNSGDEQKALSSLQAILEHSRAVRQEARG